MRSLRRDAYGKFQLPISMGLGYFLSILGVAFSTLVLISLRDDMNPTIIALLYLLSVGSFTAIWGLGVGILVALLSFLALNYFFIPPYYTLFVHQTQDLLGLVIFLGVSIAINQLVGRAQQSRSRALAREFEAVRLYELSNRLAGLHEPAEIAHAIAEQSLIAFKAERVTLLVEASQPYWREPVQVRVEAEPGLTRPAAHPAAVIPLQSARGFLGEMSIWRKDEPITTNEQRLLQTFASQGVLALERARLSEVDTRARVLEESDRLKSSLLSSVSHELRTPLATIKASVTSLRSETISLDEDAREDLLAVVEEETDHLNQLVENLLNMARIEAGALKPRISWNTLSEILASAIKKSHIQTQRHKLIAHLPDDLPLVPVDYFQIEQVLTNLISNSIKYSPEGSTVRVEAEEYAGNSLLITVSNQGPNVPEEHLERIFDKFYRITAADRVTGAGLGLSICKGIIEAHGGRIWAENHTSGFVFHFTLPLSQAGFDDGGGPHPVIE